MTNSVINVVKWKIIPHLEYLILLAFLHLIGLIIRSVVCVLYIFMFNFYFYVIYLNVCFVYYILFVLFV